VWHQLRFRERDPVQSGDLLRGHKPYTTNSVSKLLQGCILAASAAAEKVAPWWSRCTKKKPGMLHFIIIVAGVNRYYHTETGAQKEQTNYPKQPLGNQRGQVQF